MYNTVNIFTSSEHTDSYDTTKVIDSLSNSNLKCILLKNRGNKLTPLAESFTCIVLVGGCTGTLPTPLSISAIHDAHIRHHVIVGHDLLLQCRSSKWKFKQESLQINSLYRLVFEKRIDLNQYGCTLRNSHNKEQISCYNLLNVLPPIS